MCGIRAENEGGDGDGVYSSGMLGLHANENGGKATRKSPGPHRRVRTTRRWESPVAEPIRNGVPRWPPLPSETSAPPNRRLRRNTGPTGAAERSSARAMRRWAQTLWYQAKHSCVPPVDQTTSREAECREERRNAVEDQTQGLDLMH
jgi:hypothetical protein